MARLRKNAARAQDSLLPPDEVVEIPVEEQPYPLPKGWKWVRLGSTISLHRGVSYKKTDAHSIPSANDCLIMRGGNICEGYINLYTDNVYVDKSLISQDQFIKNLDIIIVTSTGSKNVIGRAGISFQDYSNVAFGAFLTLARINDGYNRRYISFYFQSNLYRNRIRKLSTGVNINNVRSEYITESELPFPPLDEQQRIVERIESLFAKLDEAKAKAESVLDGFEIRKAAILHKAFTGELTAKWREEKNISLDSWNPCPLISVLKERPRNGYSPKPVEYKTSIKSMTLSATTSGFFRSEFFKYIDEEIPEDSHLWLSYGDILIQRANSLEKVGTSAIYTEGEHEFIYPDLMMKLRVKSSHSYKYIAYILSTQTTLSYFRAKATGTAGNMPKINQQTVSNTPIVVPSHEEQQEIVRILDNFLAKEQQAKEAAETVLNQIDLMKKAILARAFRGELTR